MYGCHEVPIGSLRSKKNRETVDFLVYEPGKKVFRCYEILPGSECLAGNMKHLWYGHYNYLVVPSQTAQMMTLASWKKVNPDGIGLIVANPEEGWMKIKIAPKKWEIADTMEEELTNSLLRAMYNRLPHDKIT